MDSDFINEIVHAIKTGDTKALEDRAKERKRTEETLTAEGLEAQRKRAEKARRHRRAINPRGGRMRSPFGPMAKCDTCGKPATNGARDVMHHEVPGEEYVQSRPIGQLKYGCDDHPVESVEYRTQLPPIERTHDARPSEEAALGESDGLKHMGPVNIIVDFGKE